jgi:hypothetical protein
MAEEDSKTTQNVSKEDNVSEKESKINVYKKKKNNNSVKTNKAKTEDNLNKSTGTKDQTKDDDASKMIESVVTSIARNAQDKTMKKSDEKEENNSTEKGKKQKGIIIFKYLRSVFWLRKTLLCNINDSSINNKGFFIINRKKEDDSKRKSEQEGNIPRVYKGQHHQGRDAK